MTWELQATVSDDIHRLVNVQGETLWGVTHRGFDADHPEALGAAEVDLPTGRTSLLLVKPLPGGLVLDAVRSYQGLVEGELSTLFLGIFDELLTTDSAPDRLCLEAIGLDAGGHPRIIPGIRRIRAPSVRFAIGEMIYHAAHGRPWAESLLPVNIALPECSQLLRTLVAELLDESAADSGLHVTIAEVTAALRRAGTPSALPLLPAERDLDPGQALTARLRAASAPTPASAFTAAHSPAPAHSRTAAHPHAGPHSRAAAESRGAAEPPAHVDSPELSGAARRLRAASRDSARRRRPSPRRRRRRASLFSRTASVLAAGRRGLLERLPTGRRRPRTWLTGLRACALLAASMTILGGAVMVWSWDSEEPATSVSSAQDQAVSMSDDEVVALLDDLCRKRSEALSSGDDEGLQALTIPDSSAAAADELLDLQAFVGNDYSIDVVDVAVREQTEASIIIDARMSTSASVDGEQSEFAPKYVEFELARHAGSWKILQVTEIEH